MLFKKITILEHDDFFFKTSSNNEPLLHLFRFKQDDEEFVSDKEFVSDEEVSRELGAN